MRRLVLQLISLYQVAISPWLGAHCRFYPSCSEGAHLTIEKEGVLKGLWLTLQRLLLCHPFYTGEHDPLERNG